MAWSQRGRGIGGAGEADRTVELWPVHWSPADEGSVVQSLQLLLATVYIQSPRLPPYDWTVCWACHLSICIVIGTSENCPSYPNHSSLTWFGYLPKSKVLDTLSAVGIADLQVTQINLINIFSPLVMITMMTIFSYNTTPSEFLIISLFITCRS